MGMHSMPNRYSTSVVFSYKVTARQTHQTDCSILTTAVTGTKFNIVRKTSTQQ